LGTAILSAILPAIDCGDKPEEERLLPAVTALKNLDRARDICELALQANSMEERGCVDG
jgi:hypothetical protein